MTADQIKRYIDAGLKRWTIHNAPVNAQLIGAKQNEQAMAQNRWTLTDPGGTDFLIDGNSVSRVDPF